MATVRRRKVKLKKYRLTAQDIELIVADDFNFRQNIIVPNVHWGLGLLYEADMVVLRKSGYAIEVEIKVTSQDIKADLKKRHHHDSNLFRELWFAVPAKLADHPDIPSRAGIISLEWHPYRGEYMCVRTRGAKANTKATRWTDAIKAKLTRLGCMRTWGLKAHLKKLRRDTRTIEED